MSDRRVTITRKNGPDDDRVVTATFSEEQIETMIDTIALVNKVANDKEQWTITIGKQIVTPIVTD